MCGSKKSLVIRDDRPLVINFLGTRHAIHGKLVDELADAMTARIWVEKLYRRMNWGSPRWVPNEKNLCQLRGVRESLNSIFWDRVRGEELGKLLRKIAFMEGKTKEARERSRASKSSGAYLDFVLAVLASTSWVLSCEGDMKLRSCRNDRCIRFFVSSNPRKKWCSDLCGNRERVRRHYRSNI